MLRVCIFSARHRAAFDVRRARLSGRRRRGPRERHFGEEDPLQKEGESTGRYVKKSVGSGISIEYKFYEMKYLANFDSGGISVHSWFSRR